MRKTRTRSELFNVLMDPERFDHGYMFEEFYDRGSISFLEDFPQPSRHWCFSHSGLSWAGWPGCSLPLILKMGRSMESSSKNYNSRDRCVGRLHPKCSPGHRTQPLVCSATALMALIRSLMGRENWKLGSPVSIMCIVIYLPCFEYSLERVTQIASTHSSSPSPNRTHHPPTCPSLQLFHGSFRKTLIQMHPGDRSRVVPETVSLMS